MFDSVLKLAGALRVQDLSELPDARIEEEFAQLHRAMELLESERLRRLAEIDRRGIYQRDGHLSAVSWLASAHRVSRAAAAEQVRCARALQDMPRTRAALESGEVSLAAAKALATARQVDAGEFARAEALLIDAARHHSMKDLHRVIGYWRERVQTERLGFDQLRAGRRLHASATLSGMVRVDGDLDPETGEALMTALAAVMDAEAKNGEEDERTPAQRRADAMGEICRGWLDVADRPEVAGERPHLTLTVDVGRFADGGPGELDRVGPVAIETIKRLGCDASVTRVVMAGQSEPLDVGRRTAIVPPAIRRAVVARDRTCRFPGCDRHQAWCDAHHVVHWADGGVTAVSNLVLLCRRHHRAVHEGFAVSMVDGQPVFRRPDGSPLDGRAPPSWAA